MFYFSSIFSYLKNLKILASVVKKFGGLIWQDSRCEKPKIVHVLFIYVHSYSKNFYSSGSQWYKIQSFGGPNMRNPKCCNSKFYVELFLYAYQS